MLYLACGESAGNFVLLFVSKSIVSTSPISLIGCPDRPPKRAPPEMNYVKFAVFSKLEASSPRRPSGWFMRAAASVPVIQMRSKVFQLRAHVRNTTRFEVGRGAWVSCTRAIRCRSHACAHLDDLHTAALKPHVADAARESVSKIVDLTETA